MGITIPNNLVSVFPYAFRSGIGRSTIFERSDIVRLVTAEMVLPISEEPRYPSPLVVNLAARESLHV